MLELSSHDLIAHLNAIRVGDLGGIREKIEQAKEGCVRLAQPELAELLQEALAALDVADVKTYRRRVETVVSRLGHLRSFEAK
jgi:hypothetical protein